MGNNLDLSVGDFVYQSDQELFLVVIGEADNSYQFAVHGWRDIDKNRLDEYISHESGKLYKQDAVTKHIAEEGDADMKESFEAVKEMFAEYNGLELTEGGPQEDFALDES